MREYKLNSADVIFRCNASDEDLIDTIEGSFC